MNPAHAINAHEVPCPVCRAPKGKNCRYPNGENVSPEFSHSPRAVEVMRMLESTGLKAREKTRDSEPLLSGWSIEIQTPDRITTDRSEIRS